MSQLTLRNGMCISDYGVPYVIAEVNSSHNGNMDVAKKMIETAVKIGCDCVKFQSWSTLSLYSKTYYKQNPIAKRFVNKLSLLPDELKELADYCKKLNISFSSTPYNEEEVDFLIDECNAPFIKIASMEINNPDFLTFIGKKKVPVILSTGMSDYDEVKDAVNILEEAGCNQIALLHCVSIYPTVLTTVNLNNIIGLRELFPKYPIGFSDHTNGDAAAVAAVTLGAGIIEKHLTLDHSKVGMDNNMATEPYEFHQLVSKCKDIQIALGGKERVIQQEEVEQRTKMRRSIVANKPIAKGSVIKKEDLYAKRPGNGISPDQMDKVIGKVAAREIDEDTLIFYEDIM